MLKIVEVGEFTVELVKFLKKYSKFNTRNGAVLYLPTVNEREASLYLDEKDLNDFRNLVSYCEQDNTPNLLIKE